MVTGAGRCAESDPSAGQQMASTVVCSARAGDRVHVAADARRGGGRGREGAGAPLVQLPFSSPAVMSWDHCALSAARQKQWAGTKRVQLAYLYLARCVQGYTRS